MGDFLYQAREKCQLYVRLPDLKRKYQVLLNEKPSFSRNYNLWQLESEINFTRFRWDSIKIPPLAFSQVHRVVNTEATKEEVFIDESVPKFSQVLTPNSLPDATSDSTLDCDSISGSKIDLVNGLNGFLRSTSKMEDSANSIGDFIVSPSEEIESVPANDDDEDDYLDLKLIPQFLFVETEEDDDCLDFELLISSFFFYEEEDLPDDVNFQTTEVMSTDSSCEKHQSLKELVINHRKLLCKDCSPILLDYSRVLFDRGKRFVVIGSYPCCVRRISTFCFDSCSIVFNGLIIKMVDYHEIFSSKIVNKDGYQPDWLFSELTVGISAEGGVSSLLGRCSIKCFKGLSVTK
ncbi:hypothetical protein MKX03_029876 [Papaver bracteatum]|nr:hypothetical protein MKX03_029876 [Papaver bracteatum]